MQAWEFKFKAVMDFLLFFWGYWFKSWKTILFYIEKLRALQK